MTNPTPDLLPCPFCGGVAQIDTGLSDAPFSPGEEHVYCTTVFLNSPTDSSCGASQSGVGNWNRRAAWNTRTPTPAPNAGAVKVKPLSWIGDARWPSTSWADGYQINEQDENEWLLTTPKGDSITTHTLDDAKAAAQADYAARIMAALDVQPDPRDEVIARLVESLGMVQTWLNYDGRYDMHGINAALAAAKAVMK